MTVYIELLLPIVPTFPIHSHQQIYILDISHQRDIYAWKLYLITKGKTKHLCVLFFFLEKNADYYFSLMEKLQLSPRSNVHLVCLGCILMSHCQDLLSCIGRGILNFCSISHLCSLSSRIHLDLFRTQLVVYLHNIRFIENFARPSCPPAWFSWVNISPFHCCCLK